MLVKEVLNKVEEKFDDIDVTDKHPYLKAFGLGAIEGAIDGAVIWFPIVLGACYYWRKKAQGK